MKKDKIVNLSTLFMGVLFLLLTFTIKEPVSDIGIGPKAWPQLLAIIIISLSVFNILKDYIDNKRDNKRDNKAEENEVHVTTDYPHNLWISIAMLCLYVLIMPYIGFVVSTLIFVGVNSYIMGLKKWKMLIPVVLGILIVLVVVFPKFLGVPLPRGIGIFNTISRIFH